MVRPETKFEETTMKTALLATVALIFCGAAAAEPLFSPVENDFSVAFVAAPKVQPPSTNDKAVGAFRQYVAQQGGETFALTVDAYPASFTAPAPTQATYQRLSWAHAREANAAVVAERPAMLSGRPGWEGTYRTSAGNIEVRRILMVGNRIYQLSDTASQVGARAEDFFSSFRISPWALAHWQEPAKLAS